MEARTFDFTVVTGCPHTQARRGQLLTRHGMVETPVFMPVGTLGTVKALDARDLSELRASLILANAYHLMLRPGSETVRAFGGLHGFAGQRRAILCDSGGFQVFSLPTLREVTDRGVVFRSHLDGTLYDLTPERLVEVQEDLCPDIAMVLDECPPARSDRDVVQRAMDRTSRWARRCLEARRVTDVAWFGIVQGALFADLRTAHAEEIGEMPFSGVAIGGVSVGEPPAEIERIVAHTAPLLPPNRPRYLMGVGTPQDLVRGVAAGIDMFDCVMPSRNARNGTLFRWGARLNIKNRANRWAEEPIDDRCTCYTCKNVSVAFLRHLFVSRELSYYRLATLHNIAFYLQLMQRMRSDLENQCFAPQALLAELNSD